jgi:hypothetical protein
MMRFIRAGLILSGLGLAACAHEPPPAPPQANGRRDVVWSHDAEMSRQELGPDYTPAGSGAVPTRREYRAWKQYLQQTAQAERRDATVR